MSCMKVLVSACLMGRNCKYNGGNNYSVELQDFLNGKAVIGVCTEVAAGMPVPRPPVEIVEGVVTDIHGKNVDVLYRQGVARVMEQIQNEDIEYAVLQSRSPTCGVKQIYDGTFSKKLIEGRGILAEALIQAGYRVIDVEDLKNDTISREA